MTDSGDPGKWLERAGRLKQAGTARLDTAELVAVYNALYPAQPLSCTTCRGVLLSAYQSILRYLRENVSSTLTTMQNNCNYRFPSDDTLYRPFGSPVVYSNATLTDAAAERILQADPNAGIVRVQSADEPAGDTLADAVASATTLPNFFAAPAPVVEPNATLTDAAAPALQPNDNTLAPTAEPTRKSNRNK